ncbi:MAG: hypothetical protein AMXMBFR81_27900 [Chthonomonas sp.]
MLLPLAVCIAGLAQSAEPVSLVYRDQAFVVRLAGQSHSVGIGPQPVPRVVHKVGERFAVWDERGITARDGDHLVSARLEDAALSPKLFGREEILKTRELIESGRRQKSPGRLAGTLLAGTVAYFLPRWEDFDGNPWLEALYSVDLSQPRPVPKLEGKFEGFTVTPGPEGLGLYDGSVFAITRAGDRWGYAFFVPATGGFGFLAKGSRAETVARLSNSTALVIEQSEYGTRLVKRFHLPSGTSRLAAEVRGTVKLVSASPPVIDVDGPQGRFLRNLDSGAERAQARGTPVVGIARHVLVWTPRDNPDLGILYNPTDWSKVAEWKRPAR